MMPTTTCLLLYVLLLSTRDPLVEKLNLPVPPYLTAGLMTFACCLLAVAGKALKLIGQRNVRPIKVARSGRDLRDICVLSVCAVAIYWVTFYLIKPHALGAAGFNVIDFGAFPGLLMLAGVIFNRERLANKVWVYAVLYVIGVVMINVPELKLSQVQDRWHLMLFALVSPVAMAISDVVAQRLMGRGLDRFDILLARFVLPSVGLLGAAWFQGEFDRVEGSHVAQLLVIGLVCGSLPLMFLYMALPRVRLSYLAVWEMLLPVLIYAISMLSHPELQAWIPIVGLGLVLAAYTLLQMMSSSGSTSP